MYKNLNIIHIKSFIYVYTQKKQMLHKHIMFRLFWNDKFFPFPFLLMNRLHILFTIRIICFSIIHVFYGFVYIYTLIMTCAYRYNYTILEYYSIACLFFSSVLNLNNIHSKISYVYIHTYTFQQ